MSPDGAQTWLRALKRPFSCVIHGVNVSYQEGLRFDKKDLPYDPMKNKIKPRKQTYLDSITNWNSNLRNFLKLTGSVLKIGGGLTNAKVFVQPGMAKEKYENMKFFI